MTDPGTDSILDKVRKLLAKAEDPATTGPEAEAYTAKAAALIAKYGIDQALLAESQPGADVVGDRIIYVDGPFSNDKTIMLHTIAFSLRCRAVETRSRIVDGRSAATADRLVPPSPAVLA